MKKLRRLRFLFQYSIDIIQFGNSCKLYYQLFKAKESLLRLAYGLPELTFIFPNFIQCEVNKKNSKLKKNVGQGNLHKLNFSFRLIIFLNITAFYTFCTVVFNTLNLISNENLYFIVLKFQPSSKSVAILTEQL